MNLVDTLDDLETTEHYAQVIVSVMNQDRETPEGFYGGPAYAILREHFRGREKEVRDDAAPRAAQLRRQRSPGPDPQGGARAAGPRPRGGAGGGGRTRLLLPRASSRRSRAALPRRVPLINEAGGHIAELMLEADVMVGSGGMSVYEIAALGTPGIILGQNAREDRRMRDFAAHGTVEYLGLGTEVDEAVLASAVQALLADPARRRAMSARGRALVDGFGADAGGGGGAGAPGRARATPEGQEAPR